MKLLTCAKVLSLPVFLFCFILEFFGNVIITATGQSTLIGFTTTTHTQNNTSDDNNIFHDFDFRIKSTNSL